LIGSMAFVVQMTVRIAGRTAGTARIPIFGLGGELPGCALYRRDCRIFTMCGVYLLLGVG
jgi:hypothetical protein